MKAFPTADRHANSAPQNGMHAQARSSRAVQPRRPELQQHAHMYPVGSNEHISTNANTGITQSLGEATNNVMCCLS